MVNYGYNVFIHSFNLESETNPTTIHSQHIKELNDTAQHQRETTFLLFFTILAELLLVNEMNVFQPLIDLDFSGKSHKKNKHFNLENG